MVEDGLTSNVISGTIENFPTDGRYIFEAYCDDEVIATTEIASNGKFTITLPPELPKDMLYTLESASTINIRDESVLISGSINFGIRKENESGSSYRSFIYGYINQEVVKINYKFATLIHSDGDIKVFGKTSDYTLDVKAPIDVNVSLVKGWNWLVTYRT